MVNLFFLILLSLVGLFGYLLFKKRRIDRQQHEELYDVFDGHPITPPILETQQISWWPTFTVTFSNQSDYEYAKNNGLFDIFNNRIQKKFYDKGFAAELGITYRWIK